MRRFIALTIALMMCLMIISGCDSSKNTSGTASISNPFLGGTTGVLLDFQEGMPPKEVFDAGEYPFSVTLKVENRGEADIKKEDMAVSLTGIKASDFGLTDADLSVNPSDKMTRRFKDANGNIIEGATEYVNFDNLNFKDTLAGNQEFTIRGEVCYNYQTKAVSKICITKNILDTTYTKVCRVDESKTVYNSGAPVQISNFKELPRGKDKVQFTFDITHSSNSDLFKASSGCDYKFQNENKIFVTVDSGMTGLKCTGLTGGNGATTGEITLYNRKATVSCTQDASNVASDFEKIVNIQLDYELKDYKETKVIVKHGVDE